MVVTTSHKLQVWLDNCLQITNITTTACVHSDAQMTCSSALCRKAVRCFLSVKLVSTLQYLDHSLLLLVTSASDLPLCTIKFCSVVFGITLRLLVINSSSSSPVNNKGCRLPATSVTNLPWFGTSTLFYVQLQLFCYISNQPIYHLQWERFVQPLLQSGTLLVSTPVQLIGFWHLRTGLKLKCLNLATRNCFGAIAVLQIRLVNWHVGRIKNLFALYCIVIESLTACDEARYWLRIAIFVYPTCTELPGGPCQNIAIRFDMEKIEWSGYLTMKKFWRHVHSFRQNTQMWLTDGRTDTERRHSPRLCIASCTKNVN